MSWMKGFNGVPLEVDSEVGWLWSLWSSCWCLNLGFVGAGVFPCLLVVLSFWGVLRECVCGLFCSMVSVR